MHKPIVVVADEIVVMELLASKQEEEVGKGILHRNSVGGGDRKRVAIIFLPMAKNPPI